MVSAWSIGRSLRSRRMLEQIQLCRLNALLACVVAGNAFYRRKLDGRPVFLQRIEQLAELPLTRKEELQADQAAFAPYGSNWTQGLGQPVRVHQTSGSRGQPLYWRDDSGSWQALLDNWQAIFEAAGVSAHDRLFFPFHFGPFLGFWTAFEAGVRSGCLSIAGGGLSTVARLHMVAAQQATVVFCTPTYALRMAEVAAQEGIQLGELPVRLLLVAGEPGGSVAATRRRIESAWQARVYDHYGMTEIGPAGIECAENPGGLHILESEYIAEVLDPHTLQPVGPGQEGELVVTTLSRWFSPVIRYRTGDRVRFDPAPCVCGSLFRRFPGGILGRTDDLIFVRGNNVYPSVLEDIVHSFPAVREFCIEVAEDATGTVVRLRIESEDGSLRERVVEAVRNRLYFRPEVEVVAPGTLPRAEMKARRLVRTMSPQRPTD